MFDPKLEVQVGLSNSDSTYGFFNFGSTLENIGNGTAFNVESELELFGSNPGSYQTLYTIASGSLVVPKSVLNSGESTFFGLVGTATTWIARSYILTITYQKESGKYCDPTIVQGYFTMK